MRVCFVAYFNGKNGEGDIGTKTVAKNLANEISKRHETCRIDIRSLSSWKQAKDSRPDIIHFVLAPTALGFIAAKFFSLYCKGAKVVMSAPNPTLSCRWLISHLRPDIILTQSMESERAFQDMGFKTVFLPNGVDLERFVPASDGIKEELRDKYQIDRKKFVILHVGPLIRKRNIDRLVELQAEDTQVIIAGREPYDPGLLKWLRGKGVVVITGYIENIEEIYALSDCYVFPTDPKNKGASIEMPLSVIEAMACDLPVISTGFGALPGIIKSNDGFIFCKNHDEIYKNLYSLRNMNNVAGTRDMVLQLSWAEIAEKLEAIYLELQ